MTNSVCIYNPMRNESKFIQRWFDSAQHADHLLLVDTGSTDNSVELARGLGIEVVEARVEPFRFDVARNLALSLIPKGIDLGLMMDLDEYLDADWRAVVDKLPREQTRWTYALRPAATTVGAGVWTSVPRANLHRISANHYWKYPVHEYLHGDPPQGEIDITQWHDPDDGKPRDYMRMLEQAVQDDPTSARMHLYLGREQVNHGRWNPARKTLTTYLQLADATWEAERSEAYILLGRIDHYPERWYLKAVGECPQRREPWAMLAYEYVNQARWREAASMIELAMQRTDRSIYINRWECWDEPFVALATKVKEHLE